MRLFGVIVLAAILSCVAGFAVSIALNTLIACRSDPAGCGLAAFYTVVAVPIEAILVMIVLAIAMLFRNRLRAIAVVAIVLAVLAWSLILVGLSSDASSGRATQLADILDMVQIVLPFCVVVVTQWLVLRWYLRRRLVQPVVAS